MQRQFPRSWKNAIRYLKVGEMRGDGILGPRIPVSKLRKSEPLRLLAPIVAILSACKIKGSVVLVSANEAVKNDN